MGDLREATEAFVSDRPERAADLQKVLTVDEERDDWTREDVPVDSDDIEKLVSRGIVVRTDDGMTVADRAAIRDVLETRRTGRTDLLGRNPWMSARGRTLVLFALAGALAVVAFVRVGVIHDHVFRNGDVVFPANDPYRYRYWVDFLANRFRSFGIGSFTHLPGGIANDDVLTFLTMWGIASIFGTDPRTIGTILAWLPVVEAVVTAVLVYLLTVRLSDDFRAGLVAVLFLAIVPIYVTRTTLGFADHHAFDSVWLAVTALSIVLLAADRTRASDTPSSRGRLSRWLPTVGLGIGVAGQVLSWRGGPLFIAPILVCAVLKAVYDLSANRLPFRENRQLVIGLCLGSVVTILTHVGFGWLPSYRTFAPLLLLSGTAVAFGLAESVHRWGVIRTAGGTIAALGIVVLVVVVASISSVGGFVRLSPLESVWSLFAGPLELLAVYLEKTGQSSIMETYPLFGSDVEGILRPVRAFGLVLFLALPYMAWATWVVVRERRPEWLVVAVYAWFFFVLSIVQIRFAGQLALFVVPFAGVGFVHLATNGRLRRPFGFPSSSDGKRTTPSVSLPNWWTILVVLFLFLLVVPTGLYVSSVQQRKMSVTDETYRTAKWIDGYAARHGKTYPDDYVFSEWSYNRAYNYLVSGQSKEYAFAQKYYYQFLASTAPDAWARQLDRWNHHGFVVLRPEVTDYSNRMAYTRLYDHFGSRANGVPGLDHYRAVHVSRDGGTRVFEIVPGARLTTTGPPNATVRVRTTVNIGGRTIQYRRVGRTNRYGEYGVTVPYSGRYTLNGETRRVGDAAVRNGNLVGSYRVHYPFDTGHGRTIADPVGGTQGTVHGASWERGARGTALAFRGGTDYAETTGEPLDVGNGSFSVAVRLKGDLGRSNDSTPHVLYGYNSNTKGGYLLYEQGGRLCARLTDDHARTVTNCGIGTTTFDEWTNVVFVYDRSAGELRLYRNGSLAAVKDASSIGTISDTRTLVIGSPNARYSAPMTVDDVRIYGRALSQEDGNRSQK